MPIARLTVACLAVLSFSTSVYAQGTVKAVADFQNWSVFVTDNPRQCFVANREAETEVTRDGQPTSANRGVPFLYVTHTPGQPSEVVSVFLGFPPDREKPPIIGIGGTTYQLLPGEGGEREWAWVQPQDDNIVLKGMVDGALAVVTSQSTTAKTIADSFSLLGFTDALTDARARCEASG